MYIAVSDMRRMIEGQPIAYDVDKVVEQLEKYSFDDNSGFRLINSEEAAGEYLGHKPRTVTGKHYSYKSEEHTLRIFQDYVAAV